MISDCFLENPLGRLRQIDPLPGVEAIPLRIDEFRKLREKKNLIAVEADTTGIVIRDDLGIFSHK